MRTIIFPTTDLAATTAVFRALLGVEPTVSESFYVGFDVDGLHLGLNPNGAASGMTAPVPYWHVDDIAATTAALLAAGGSAGEAAHEVGGGRQVGSVLDADGNAIGLIQDA